MQPQRFAGSSVLLRVWRGELGLYRSAYALGGLSFALVSLIGDTILDMSASAGGATGWLCYSAVGLGELAFAWVAVVATWRAVRRGSRSRAYGPISICLALAFVWIQLVLTAGWIGWSGLAGLGLGPTPVDILLPNLSDKAPFDLIR
jgi:hypothetical protein